MTKQRINRIRDLGELERFKEIVEKVEHTEISDLQVWNEMREDGLWVQRCEFKCEQIEKWWTGWYMMEVHEGKWMARGRICRF